MTTKRRTAPVPSMLRQGDVALVRVDSIPAKARKRAKENGRVILAHGEVTGHAHGVEGGNAVLLDAPDGTVYLIIDERIGGATVVHEEHDTLPLEAGMYKVIRQREYTPTEIRDVTD